MKKTNKNYLFFILAILLTVFWGDTIVAQTITQVGSGTSSLLSYSPISRSGSTSTNTNQRGCFIITQADMTGAGIPSGAVITGIQFECRTTGVFVTPVYFAMYMANSANTSLTTGMLWTDLMTYHTQVYVNNNFNVVGVSGTWQEWDIAPFTYTGNSLEIATEAAYSGAGSSTGQVGWRGTSGASPKAIGAFSTTGVPPASLDGTSSSSKVVPNVKILWSLPAQPQSITFNAFAPVTYGVADFAPGATTSSGLSVSYSSSNTSVATIVNNQIHITGAGTTTITASQAGNAAYQAAANVQQTLTVNKAALQIKANDLNMLTGQPVPTLTLTYTGLVYSETAAVLSTPATVTTTATSSSPPGSYPISVGGAVAANYTISYVNGIMTVAAQTQTITFGNMNKTYGDTDFDPGATASSGLPVSYGSSNTSVATIVNNQIHIVGAGTATITASQPGNIDFSAAPDVAVTLTVNKANQALTLNDITKTYGATDFSPATVSSGLIVTYTSSNPAVATINNGAVHIVGAGMTTITASQAGDNNYNAATAVNKTLTVNKAPLTIKANDQSVIQGYPIAAFTVTYTGLVYGETENKLQNKPVISTTITSSLVPVGSYTLQPAGASSNNYDISYQQGTLSITAVSVSGSQISAFFTSTSSCQVRVYAAAAQKAVLQMVDLSGHNLFSKELNLAVGYNSLMLPVGNLAAGPYIIKVKGPQISVVANIIKSNN